MPSLLVPVTTEASPERMLDAPGSAASGPLQAFAAILAGAQAQGASGHSAAGAERSLLLQNGASAGVPAGDRANVLGGAFLPAEAHPSEDAALAPGPALTSDALAALPAPAAQAQASGQQTASEGSGSNATAFSSNAQAAASPSRTQAAAASLSASQIVGVDVPEVGSAATNRRAPTASTEAQPGDASGKAAHGKAAHGKAAHGKAAHGKAAHGKASSSGAPILPAGEGSASEGSTPTEGRRPSTSRPRGTAAAPRATASGEPNIVTSNDGAARRPANRPTPDASPRSASASSSSEPNSDASGRMARAADAARSTPEPAPSSSRPNRPSPAGHRTSATPPNGSAGGSSLLAPPDSGRGSLPDAASASIDLAPGADGKTEGDDAVSRLRLRASEGSTSQASERSGSRSGSALHASESERPPRDATARSGARSRRSAEGDRLRMNPQSADTGDASSDERRSSDGLPRPRTSSDRAESRAQQRTGRFRDGRSAHLQGSRHGAQQQAKRKAGASRSRSLSAAKTAPSADAGSSLAPPPTDLAFGGELSLEEAEDTWSSALAKAQQSAASTKDARGAASAAPTRRSFPMAWIKAATQGPLRVSALSGGWKAVEMNLDEGDGTVTIKARRDQDKVAVSVGFSEPRMQAQAAANARQIQDALQAQYETDVDLSFSDGDGGGTDDPRSETSGHEATAARSAPSETATPDDPSSRQTSRTGARREWVG